MKLFRQYECVRTEASSKGDTLFSSTILYEEKCKGKFNTLIFIVDIITYAMRNVQMFIREQLRRMNSLALHLMFSLYLCYEYPSLSGKFKQELPSSLINLSLSELHSYNDGPLGVPKRSSACTASKVSIASIKEQLNYYQ